MELENALWIVLLVRQGLLVFKNSSEGFYALCKKTEAVKFGLTLVGHFARPVKAKLDSAKLRLGQWVGFALPAPSEVLSIWSPF